MSDDGWVARVELIDAEQAPLTVKQFFLDGDPGPIVSALATVPELVAPTLAFVGAALAPGSVGARLKEYAILRTSALQGCSYCIDAHTAASLDVGLADAEIRALRGEIPLEDAFASSAERALIGWIDALAGATGPIPDDVWQVARMHWSESALVELTVTVGATMFLNRFATGFQLPTGTQVDERLAAAGLR